MSPADLVVSVAGLLVAAALFAREMLLLRGLLLAAGLPPLGWGLWTGDWALTGWAGLATLINGAAIFGLLRQRMNIALDPELERVHAAIFPDLARREFLNFWNYGEEFSFDRGERLIAEGEGPEHLMFLLEGEVRIMRGPVELARLGPDAFVGEMSFLTGRPASADAIAAGPVRLMVWRQRKLHDLDQLNPALQARLHRILGRDLADKVARGRPAANRPPSRPDSIRPDPIRPDSIRPDPFRPDPLRPDPNAQDPSP